MDPSELPGISAGDLFFNRRILPQRERRDTLESSASSLDFHDDIEEPSFSTYANATIGDLEEEEEEEGREGGAVLESVNVLARADREISEDANGDTNTDETDANFPVQKSTTFERVLSDAIIHHAPLEELKILLEAGSGIINSTCNKPNPLHYTVWQNYPEATELILNAGYDVNVVDDYGYSALHLAARHGYIEILQLLIRHGSLLNFNKNDPEDKFPVEAKDEPLRLAIKHGHLDAVKVLLQCGADANARYFFGSEINLVSPLKPDILELLLRFGAHVNQQDRNGLTPLMKACRHRQGMESLLLLLSYGGDVNIRADSRHDHRTALHYAVLSGATDIVQMLIESGAKVVFEEEYNKPTPLHLAVRRGDIKMIHLLLDLGADINSSTSLIGSVLHMACSERVHNRLEVMEVLLSRGAEPNIIVTGLDGTPMLPPLGDYLIASDELDVSVVSLMLRYGAEVIMRSSQSSPLGLLGCLSCLKHHPRLLAELLEGAQEFDLQLIKRTSLLSSDQRWLCLEVGGSPLPLRHISRVRIRHNPLMSNPKAILDQNLPSLISKYLLYEIS